jgi:retinol dehydrogenase-12
MSSSLTSLIRKSSSAKRLNLKGVNVIITGATSGLGLSTAEQFAHCGAHVVIASRSESKSHQVIEELRQKTIDASFEYIPLDLTSFQSVREFSNTYLSNHSDLHVLVCNAGVLCTEKIVTRDGNETTFQTNHLSHFLLTNLLLPALQNAKIPPECDFSGPSRIIIVSSMFHSAANLKTLLEDSNIERHSFSTMGWSEYAQSKLANVMFSYELNRRLQQVENGNIHTYVMHPGTLSTGLYRDLSQTTFGYLFNPIKSLFFKEAGGGAEAVLDIATSDAKRTETGLYYSGSTKSQSSSDSYKTEAWKQLWDLSERITGFHSSNEQEQQ